MHDHGSLHTTHTAVVTVMGTLRVTESKTCKTETRGYIVTT